MKKARGICPGLSAQAGEPALRFEPYFFFFFFFDFLYMPPPGFSDRWATWMSSDDIRGLNAGVSVVVELAAWADSDMAMRPAAPRSAVRTIFMSKTSMVIVVSGFAYYSGNELRMNDWITNR